MALRSTPRLPRGASEAGDWVETCSALVTATGVSSAWVPTPDVSATCGSAAGVSATGLIDTVACAERVRAAIGAVTAAARAATDAPGKTGNEIGGKGGKKLKTQAISPVTRLVTAELIPLISVGPIRSTWPSMR